jgi:hypothetical protein
MWMQNLEKPLRLDERGMCRVTTIDGTNDYMF